jgi:hypothetical protein
LDPSRTNACIQRQNASISTFSFFKKTSDLGRKNTNTKSAVILDAYMEDGSPLTHRLLSRLPFVRSSLEESRSIPEPPQETPPPTPRRRRKASLRKTALLPKGTFATSSSRHVDDYRRDLSPATGFGATTTTTTVQSSIEPFPPHADQSPPPSAGSTTDEDDLITLRARSASGSHPHASATSSPTLSRRRSSRSAAQKPIPPPLPSLSLSPGVPATMEALVPALMPSHDYASTEWWGWIILATTWLVFVVGMGSCLGVWSWAWDVGETPYAPPELEDDPTLPIVGYYPALIVMTGVMAWVWVVSAWVGMKYFRHAKVWDGEDY